MVTSKSQNSLFRIDVLTFSLYLILVMIGWFSIFSIKFSPDAFSSFFDASVEYGKQMIWMIICVVMLFVVFSVPLKVYESYAGFFYLTGVILLIGVFLFGSSINGAQSWYRIMGFQFQPSEIAKLTTTLALCKVLSVKETEVTVRHKINTFLIIFVPFVCVAFQPDMGTGLIFLSLFSILMMQNFFLRTFVIVFVAGVLFLLSLAYPPLYIASAILIILIVHLIFVWRRQNATYIVITIAVFAVMIGYVTTVEYIFDNVLSERHRNRIDLVLGRIEDPQGIGYNTEQSKIAIGSGGAFGQGFLNGTQTKGEFVPEQTTDFIFCTIGEEWGFVGGMLLNILFITLIARIYFLANRQKDTFPRIFGYSLAVIILTHFAINMGMVMGLLPVIGIPLPFISYGGSSLLSFSLMLFIFLKMDAHRLD